MHGYRPKLRFTRPSEACDAEVTASGRSNSCLEVFDQLIRHHVDDKVSPQFVLYLCEIGNGDNSAVVLKA
jgi:hypothetical protein